MKKKLLVFVALLVLALACASVALAKDVAEGGFVDWGEEDQIAKVGGHAVDLATMVPDYLPTCTDYGRLHFVCNEGDTTHNHYVYWNPLGHDWSSESNPEWGRVTKPATCTEEGEAIDVCLRCGAEDPNHIRIIDKKPHEYDDDHYVVVKEPSCGEHGEGLGQHTCIYCGQPKPNEPEAEMVVLDKIPHNWSDWRVDRDSTCLTYGEAARTCIRCGATQSLDEANPVVDQGEIITIDKVLPLKNPLWNTNLNGNAYEEQNLLEKALKDEGFEYELKNNWLADCYTRELTYTCPYCHGTEHKDFKVTLVKPATIAHIFNDEPDEVESVAPTCTAGGYDVYLCKYDGDVHEHVKGTLAERQADDAQKVVVLPKLGHDWGEWLPAEQFTKDGETYIVYFRACDRCGAHEQKTEKTEKPAVKNGLVLDDDGTWRYYKDGEVAKDFTAIVPYQGGEFWVVNGVVPKNANGLTICPDGKAYFLAQGQIQKVSQVAEYKGNWFMIKDGLLDESANGLYDYDGGKFVFAAGKLRTDVNGLWLNPLDNEWYFLANGQVQDVDQVASYNGEFFVIKNGVLDTDYNGTIEYDGKTFRVVNGQLYEEVA